MLATITRPVTPEDRIAAEFKRLNIKYAIDPQYDLASLSTDRRVQVRESAHYAPSDMVERYRHQMGHSQFPPIVVTADGWLVDGNTRAAASLKRKSQFFPAYVLDVAWEKATADQKNELVALAATLNNQNGAPLTAKETREVVARFIELGWLAENIARAIGVPASRVTTVRRQMEGAARLQKVGINPDSMPQKLFPLGGKEAGSLNDVPFKMLATLANDADLSGPEIGGLAKRLKETGSDAGAISMLEDLRDEMGDRIKQRRLTGVGKPSQASRLRQSLGNVTKWEGREEELVEALPSNADAHVAVIETAVRVLTRVLEAQKR